MASVIEVSSLTKQYGDAVAVHDVSFSALAVLADPVRASVREAVTSVRET
jgi:hypothetical protein